MGKGKNRDTLSLMYLTMHFSRMNLLISQLKINQSLLSNYPLNKRRIPSLGAFQKNQRASQCKIRMALPLLRFLFAIMARLLERSARLFAINCSSSSPSITDASNLTPFTSTTFPSNASRT